MVSGESGFVAAARLVMAVVAQQVERQELLSPEVRALTRRSRYFERIGGLKNS